nr:uncharacterized protein LOC132779779 [Anolis sagrei ordinatus]
MASTTAVTPYARLKMRPLQFWFLSVFNPLWDHPSTELSIPPNVKHSLAEWMDERWVCQGLPFQPPSPVRSMTTDSSLSGWGAHSQGLIAHGVWSTNEADMHINVLELLAVDKGLKSFEKVLSGKVIQVLTDNTTVMYYLNKQGGTHSGPLLDLCLEIWNWCISRRIHLIVTHLPGVDNGLADVLSRSPMAHHEWSLNGEVSANLFRLWGTPEVDLFATPQNTKCGLFCARCHPLPQIGCLGDAFLHNWGGRLVYAFPPFPLLLRVIAKIRRDNAHCVLVTPWWPRQPWFAPLLQLSRNNFLQFRHRSDLLTSQGGQVLYPEVHQLGLTAWLVLPNH